MRSQLYRLLLFVFVLPTLSFGQHDWHKIKISLDGKSMRDLQQTGLAFDHGQYVPGVSFTGDFSHLEMEKLESSGFKFEIVANKILRVFRLFPRGSGERGQRYAGTHSPTSV